MRSQSLLMSHCVRLPTYSFVTFVASFQCSQSPAPLAFCHFTLQSCSNGARQPLAYYMAAPDPSGLLGEKAYRHLKNSSLAISSRPPPLSRTHSGPPCRRAKRYSEILEGRRSITSSCKNQWTPALLFLQRLPWSRGPVPECDLRTVPRGRQCPLPRLRVRVTHKLRLVLIVHVPVMDLAISITLWQEPLPHQWGRIGEI
ncbi:uncharacterized protein LOC111561284 isoform X3 [Felis catus]|uniref:uncharacterized protein LOC111561284 isoform X3 n=1 Tax=Felis catus TaxID=9685 RepID=UPI001D19E633|nr:uncharacterized protein LOC111561284 isoform X3 [Felis catus]